MVNFIVDVPFWGEAPGGEKIVAQKHLKTPRGLINKTACFIGA